MTAKDLPEVALPRQCQRQLLAGRSSCSCKFSSTCFAACHWRWALAQLSLEPRVQLLCAAAPAFAMLLHRLSFYVPAGRG